MGIPADFQEMVGRLAKATKEGRIAWSERGSHSGYFEASLKRADVQLHRFSDQYGGDFISVRIIDHIGNDLYGFSLPDTDSDFAAVVTMYDQAMRQARQIDNILRSLGDELGE